MINLIFETRGMTSVLAHVLLHSVIELTLPSIDANHFLNAFFINAVGLTPTGWRRMLFGSVAYAGLVVVIVAKVLEVGWLSG